MAINDLYADELSSPPETLENAHEILMKNLPLKERVEIAKLSEEGVGQHIHFMGRRIMTYFGMWRGNKKLLESCRRESGIGDLDVPDAAMFIIKKLVAELKKTHVIRVIDGDGGNE